MEQLVKILEQTRQYMQWPEILITILAVIGYAVMEKRRMLLILKQKGKSAWYCLIEFAWKMFRSWLIVWQISIAIFHNFVISFKSEFKFFRRCSNWQVDFRCIFWNGMEIVSDEYQYNAHLVQCSESAMPQNDSVCFWDIVDRCNLMYYGENQTIYISRKWQALRTQKNLLKLNLISVKKININRSWWIFIWILNAHMNLKKNN